MKKLLIILSLLVLLPSTILAEEKTSPPLPQSTIVGDCIPTKAFPSFAKQFDLKMLGRFNSPNKLTMLFISFNRKNWLWADIDLKNKDQICIYSNGSGFELNNDFIFLDPKDSHEA